MLRKYIFLTILGIAMISGCATNPVTGKQELALVSESKEIQVGQEHYAPSRQMQGGDYVVDPELTKYVDDVGQKLVAVSDRKLPYEFKVLNNSIPNAWALPGGKIAINRGLLTELNNEAELASVLGHEMVHAAARHGAKAMERGMMLQGAVLATGIAVSDTKYANLGIIGAQLSAALISQKYSRDAEREADNYGMEYMAKAGYDPNAAVSLQEVFVRLSENKQQNWLTGLFSSHPPSTERVTANRQKALELGSGGTLGAEKFRRMTAHLRKTKEAYEAHDEGRKALSEKKTDQALTLAQKALTIEPREGLFHALRGDVRFAQQKYDDALINYNRAVERNPNFFHFYVQRGITKQKLNDPEGAKSDLENSMRLLPTATAHKALGDIALSKNDRINAMQHYKAAAGSNTPAGKQALNSLVRLDMPYNPGQYVQAKIGLSQDQFPMAKIVNATPLSVKNIRLRIRLRDASGQVREMSRFIQQTISPQKAVAIQLGLNRIDDPAMLKSIVVDVVSAEIAE